MSVRDVGIRVGTSVYYNRIFRVVEGIGRLNSGLLRTVMQGNILDIVSRIEYSSNYKIP
jgi:hypothetical protein